MTTLKDSSFVWLINVADDQSCHGWIRNDKAVASIACSICGPNAGLRRVGFLLDADSQKCLSRLFDATVLSPDEFNDIVSRWPGSSLKPDYKPLPGDAFVPSVWEDPLPDAGRKVSHPANGDLVVDESFVRQLRDAVGSAALITQLEVNGNQSIFYDVIPYYGPWSHNFSELDNSPRCEECFRDLPTHRNIASQVRSRFWKSRTMPRAILPDAPIMCSVFGSGVIANSDILDILRNDLDSDEYVQIQVV